jgi:hypothetical protein
VAWTQIVALAANLMACFRHLALPVGELRDAAPKLLRYRLLHLPGRLTRGQRKRSPAPRRLALDHRPDQRLAGSQGPAGTDMTSSTPTRRPGKDPTGPWNPAQPERRSGPEPAREQEATIKKPGR